MHSSLSAELKATIDTFPNELQRKIFEWLEWDKNPQTRNGIIDLIRAQNVDRLSKLLLQRQSFGTAGIRAIMEPGFNGLNDLVILQTSQGLAKHVEVLFQTNKAIGHKSVVIGYDGRHNSHRFAKLTSRVFLHLGFRVYLFSKMVPTPFVAFAVRLMSAAAGVVITASHNPKQYNGYKVFLGNGAQILSPHDEQIQEHILHNLVPWSEQLWETDTLNYHTEKELVDPLAEVMEKYYHALLQSATQQKLVSQTDLRVTYTALHGVGHPYVTEAFVKLNLKNHFCVESQKDPDPEFPTVVFPNPEEGQGVLDESIKTAIESNSTLIIANDPDVDRFLMAELHQNEWHVFNGNEIGALLGWWLWLQFTECNSDVKPTDCYMISSAVSSKILQTIAKSEGFNWLETLTGFKWMANHAVELCESQGKKVLLAFEEAIGFMVGTSVFDKDGISTAATVVQMAAYLRSINSTLLEQLNRIYEKYGLHYSLNSYYICHDAEKIKRIFNHAADRNRPNSYITEVNGIKVTRIRDLNRGFDSSTSDKKPILPTSSSSFMLTLYFENGSVITFRTSGTEPKIKYYSEIIGQPNEKNWNAIKEKHSHLVQFVVNVVLEPEKNALQAMEN